MFWMKLINKIDVLLIGGVVGFLVTPAPIKRHY